MPWQAGQSGNPATRFRPGRSGNPRGRPPGPALTPRVRAWLERDLGDGRQVADLIAEALVARAIAGDDRAIRIILDRVEGKAPDHVPEPGPGGPRVVKVLRGVSLDEL